MDRRLGIGFLLLFLVPLVTAKRGFILLTPKGLLSENTERLYLWLFDVEDTGSVQLSLKRNDGNETKTLTTVTQVVDKPSPAEGQLFQFDLQVDKVPPYSQVSVVLDGTLGSYVIHNQTDLTVYSHSQATFIQTDKPIYKPGQTVRLRILPVDEKLRPVSKQAKADVWIENPSGIRLAQWLGESFEKGMSQFEMQLSEKPDLGQWTIYVNITTNGEGTDYQLKTEYFRVEEYVLPKFEVVITPPSFALASAENVTWKICGRYTYGKLVKGNVSIVASFEGYGSWDRNVYPDLRHEQSIDGCTNYTVFQKDIGW